MDDLSKKVPLGAAVAVVVLLGGAVAGALVFADDRKDAAAVALGAVTPDPMELNGRWRGIELAGVTSPAAREAGAPPVTEGAVITARPEGNPTLQRAGLMRGDVVTGLDGNDVLDLADLFDATRDIDPTRPVAIDIVRQGQPLTLVLPPAVGAQGPPPAVAGGPPGGFPGGPNMEPPEAEGMRFFCPRDGTTWMSAQVSPEFRCLRCGGPLTRAR